LNQSEETVNDELELCRHAEIVHRRCKHKGIGFTQSIKNRRHIVGLNADSPMRETMLAPVTAADGLPRIVPIFAPILWMFRFRIFGLVNP
jgi:hypothetical protein